MLTPGQRRKDASAKSYSLNIRRNVRGRRQLGSTVLTMTRLSVERLIQISASIVPRSVPTVPLMDLRLVHTIIVAIYVVSHAHPHMYTCRQAEGNGDKHFKSYCCDVTLYKIVQNDEVLCAETTTD